MQSNDAAPSRPVLPPPRYSGDQRAFRQEVMAVWRQSRAARGARSLRSRGQRKASFVALALTITLVVAWSGAAPGALLAISVTAFQVLCLVAALGVGHDSSHGAFARSRFANRIGAAVFDLVGVNGYVWHFDHVVSHHVAPNVSRYDANLYVWGPLRLDPHTPPRWWHRAQHIYAPLLYCLASLFKLFVEDFTVFGRRRADAFLPLRHSRAQIARLVASKLWALAVGLVLPVLLNPGRTSWVLTGYAAGHVIAGTLMGAIFQPTHTNEHVTWPVAGPDGRLSTTLEAHVLSTACDFAVESPFVTWLAGGLNVHAIHHLFPGVPHLELPELAAVVRTVAPRHGLTYRTFPTWGAALRSHFRALAELGSAPCLDQMTGTKPI